MSHATGDVWVDSTAWRSVVDLRDAHRGHAYAVRLRGQGIDWRLLLRGAAGEQVVSSGQLPAGDDVTARLPALPDGTLGANRLTVQVRLSTTGAARHVTADVTWRPVEPGVHPAPHP